MAIVFMDSARHYRDDGDITQKWDTNSTGVVDIDSHPSGAGSVIRLDETNYVEADFAANDLVTVGFYMKWLSFPATTYEIAHIRDSGSVQVALQSDFATGKLRITRGTSTATSSKLIESTSTLSANIWYYIEIYLDPEDSEGYVALRIDGLLEGQYTGDTKGGSLTTAQKLRLYNESVDDGIQYADVYVATAEVDFIAPETTVPKFAWLVPDADTASIDFLLDPTSPTTHYTHVDDDPLHNFDNQYVYESTVSDIDKFECGDVPEPTLGKVFAVQAILYAKHDGSSANFSHELTSNATTETGGTETPTTDYIPYKHLYDEDPDGPQAWDKAAVAAGEFGFKVVA